MSSNRASALGLSFRDGETLEQLANVDVVFFDKTGTLTKGELRVCGYVLADGVSEEELFEAAAIAETGSLHPIAKAISSCVELRDVPRGASKTVAGYGVEWTADATDAETLVGSASFLSSRGVEVSKLVDSDTTTVHVARNSRWLGALLLDDELRADAATTVSALRAMGLEVAMLTGDISKSALRMAKEVGLAEEEVHYELSPEGKADLIGAARDLGKRVAFVGEGLNDGPALAAANVGIAAQGSCDLALRSAPLVIQHGGIGGVVDALRLSRQTLSIMRQNLGFALIYNVTAIPVAALGFLQPIWAGAAMVASSLSVTFNSLRIKTIGGSKAPW
jgi:P-type E1-E2 ATPase